MNNPFRHRYHDDRSTPRRDWDDDRERARDMRFDEGRSWREDTDYGPGYGQSETYASRMDQPEWGRSEHDYRQPRHDDWRGGRGRWAGERGGHGQARADYGTAPSQAWPQHAYAPGSQIWDAPDQGDRDYYGARGWSGRQQHDLEPDYLHWRNEQLANFDRDYRAWRDERRQKFSLDFHSWRQNRPQTHNEAANPIVGDITDGGDGRKGRDKI